MPELPDVETFRDLFERTSLGRDIADAEVRSPEMLEDADPEALVSALRGSSFGEAARHGKWLLARLESGPWLGLHFGMSGRLVFLDDGDEPAHTRLLVRFADGTALAYDCVRKLGHLALVDAPEELVEAHRLGPDALSLASRELERALGGRRGTIKGRLLDQGVVAGIGNVYADEILFQARLHPATRVDELDEERRRRLAGAVRRVLRTATDRDADPGAFPAGWLTPDREEGAPCPRCGGTVIRTRVAGRSTYLCPACQQAP